MNLDYQKLTPMMRQYLEVKERYPDAFVFFRVGDFYELFFDDAIKASAILNIALTSRDKSEKDAVPLCGVPFHAVEAYIKKMIAAGHKIVLCDQVEDPKLAKGIVKREVVRVITPGTITELGYLDPKNNNYIAALYRDDEKFGVAFTDVSCGEVSCFKTANILKDVFERISLSEVVVLKKDAEQLHNIEQLAGCPVSFLEIDIENIKGLSAEEKATSLLKYYLSEVVMLKNMDNKTIKHLPINNYLFIDENSKRDLEVFESALKGEKKSSLLDVMDCTITSMGGRKLRQFLSFPLLDKAQIESRYNIVENLVKYSHLLNPLRDVLKGFSDLERIIGNLFGNSPCPKFVTSLKNSLLQIVSLKNILENIPDMLEIFALNELTEVVELIDTVIAENPPMSLREGGIIKRGYSQELEILREIIEGGAEFLFEYQKIERERTGISSLKVSYNKIFGYYIEVSKTNVSLVPSNYIRKQTLVNAERYITDELKKYEEKVLSASEKFKELEIHLFENFLNLLKIYSSEIKKLADEIALLDVYSSFAFSAIRYNYTRPRISEEPILTIKDGRHPFVEQSVKNFVPNDTDLESKKNNIMLITGPNMSGKSTYMRQVALIVTMAQIGSFVPATSMEFAIVDQIFTRIGASDFLASGKSTFMVEMIETARILKESTAKSLVVLDEVGRGTSTYDGMAIAWAVLEHLADKAESPFVLFSTHYHEIAELANKKSNIKNYNVSVKEWNNEIIFLHKVKKGIANKSYGIHVAKLAGLPNDVISRALEILKMLEEGELLDKKPNLYKNEPQQLSLFVSDEKKVIKELEKVDINLISPIEAFDILRNLKRMIKND